MLKHNEMPGAVASAQSWKPMMRWWIPAGFSDPEEIHNEIVEAAQGGFGGLEICLTENGLGGGGGLPPKTKEDLEIKGWAGPGWKQQFKDILKTANEQGIRMDVTISPAWPASSYEITPADEAAAKELLICSTDTFTGTYDGPLPTKCDDPNSGFVGGGAAGGPGPGGPPDGPMPGEPGDMPLPPGMAKKEPLPNKTQLLAVIAARVTGTKDITKEQVIHWGDMPLMPNVRTRTTTLLDKDSLTVLPIGAVTQGDEGWTAHWTAPEGQWKLFACWMKGTAQTSKAGTITPTPDVCVDIYSEKGAQAVMEVWQRHLLNDPELVELLKANGGTIFHDSLEHEVSSGALFWSPVMLDKFREHRGYDLTPWLPLLHGMNHGGMATENFYTYELEGDDYFAEQVRNDYRMCVTQNYIEGHILPISQWAQTFNYDFRSQCYSALFDLGLPSATINYPEGEALGFGHKSQGDDRFRLISGGAHMGLKNGITNEVGAIADKGYRLTWGEMLFWINKNISHGANQMIFHGYHYDGELNTAFPPGLSSYWTRRQAYWRHINDLSDYLTGVQTLLHWGKPRQDVAVLKQMFGMPIPMFEDQTMAQRGYTYDILTPPLMELPTAVSEKGVFCPEGAGYRAIVVDKAKTLPGMSLMALKNAAENGVKVVFVGDIPGADSYNDVKFDHSGWYKLRDEVLAHANVFRAETEARVPDILAENGVLPLAANGTEAMVCSTCRSDGIQNAYHLFNESSEAVTLDVTLTGSGPVYIYDPWQKKVWRTGYTAQGSVTIPMTFRGWEVKIFIVGGQEPEAMDLPKLSSTVTLDSGWSLELSRYVSTGNPQLPAETKEELFVFPDPGFTPWCQLIDGDPGIVGVGNYTRSFNWDGGSTGVIKLEKANFASLRVYVNDVLAPVNQYTLEAYTEALRPGENTLRIELSSTLGNQLLADGTMKKTPWCVFPEAYEIQPFGLLGAVTVNG